MKKKTRWDRDRFEGEVLLFHDNMIKIEKEDDEKTERKYNMVHGEVKDEKEIYEKVQEKVRREPSWISVW